MTKSKLTVGAKFARTGGLLMVLVVLLGGAALTGLGELQGIVNQLANDSLPGLSRCATVESALNELRGDILKHVGTPDQKTKKAAEANIQKLKAAIGMNLSEYERTVFTDEDRRLFAKIVPALETYYNVCDEVLAVSRAGKNNEAYQKYEDESIKTGVFRAAKAAIQAETEFNRKSGARLSAAAAAAGARARWLIWLFSLTSLLSGSTLLYFIVRGVSQALRRAAVELADGADKVASSASVVSAASQSLAQGASEQAASLEETSASSEEINSMARRNSTNSRSAADLVRESQQKFLQANLSLDQMVVAMGEINSSSDKISRIIKVIDEIAFQTNILALNAAVEAARAGEAGMGFAVVADEVRTLAQRCSQAAKDTSALIAESIAKSNDGTVKVDQVASAIRSITEESGKVKTLVEEVSLGSEEQARGIEQIAKAIAQMDQVTQTTAANAEESSAAAEELTAQSEALRDIVKSLAALVGGDA